MEESGHGLVPAVARAGAILELAAGAGRPLSMTEIAERLGIPKSSTLAICRTLVAARLMERDPATGAYRLGPQVLMLSHAYLRGMDLAGEFLRLVERAPELRDETVQLAVPDGTSVVYVARRDGTSVAGFPRLGCDVGLRLPASCTAVGRAMLACRADAEVRRLYADGEALPRLTARSPRSVAALLDEVALVRRRGYAIDDEAVMEGIACVGFAVVGAPPRRPAAAVSVVLLRARLNGDTERRLAGAVGAIAGRLSQLLGSEHG